MDKRMTLVPRIALVLIACTLVPTFTFASEKRLFITWPLDWEFRQSMQHEQRALYVQGRQRVGDREVQELTMTVIDTDVAREPIAGASIKELAQRLRARFSASPALGSVQPFANARGYYFVVTGRRSEEATKYSHLIEGVMLDSGYLIEFVLQTSDAHAPATLTMLSALERFEIH